MVLNELKNIIARYRKTKYNEQNKGLLSMGRRRFLGHMGALTGSLLGSHYILNMLERPINPEERGANISFVKYKKEESPEERKKDDKEKKLLDFLRKKGFFFYDKKRKIAELDPSKKSSYRFFISDTQIDLSIKEPHIKIKLKRGIDGSEITLDANEKDLILIGGNRIFSTNGNYLNISEFADSHYNFSKWKIAIRKENGKYNVFILTMGLKEE